jgi:hypothetical protein
MVRFLISVLLLIFCSAITAQSQEELPGIRKNDLPGMKITRTRSFNGESLYGYINGGADLYLEYGFSKVEVTELLFEERKYKIEIWQMNDSEASFGIFSVSRHRCLSMPSFTNHTCLNRYQLQFSKGEFYISIVNESGTPADTVASLSFARLIEERIKGEPFDPGSYFKAGNEPVPMESLLLVRGRLGLMNGIPDLEDSFKDITDFTALISNNDDKMRISVKFNSDEQMNAFCKLNGISLPEINSASVEVNGQRFTRLAPNHLYIEKY